MATIVSPLLNAVDEVRVYGELGAERKPAKRRRGPPLAECRCCHRRIWRREYAEREGGPLGPKCGGRIRKGAERLGRRPADDELPGQGALFEVVVIKVRV